MARDVGGRVKMYDPRLPRRFWRSVLPEPNSGCWLWIGNTSNTNYGMYYTDPAKRRVAHRVSYETLVGPVPDELVLDHLCRTRCCVNPDHLEPVTMAENVYRGIGPSAINLTRTHCPHGHEYSDDNTHVTRRGWRVCKTCEDKRNTDRLTREMAERAERVAKFKAERAAVLATARSMRAQGATLAKIGEVLGVTRFSVCKLLKYHSRSEQ